MAKFGETLKRLRNARGLSQPALGAKVGVSDQTISDWEGKASATIRGWNYAKLAEALGLTTAELDREWRTGKIEQSIGDPVRRGIPLINKAPAGDIINYEECSTVDSGQGQWYIHRDGIEDPNAFCVQITGDSMVPYLYEGSIAVFSPMDQDAHTHFRREPVPEGHVVFVRFGADAKKEGCTVARWFHEKQGKIRLEKENKKYKPIVCRPEEIARIAALIRFDPLPRMTKIFSANEQLQTKGEGEKQVEGRIHPGEETQVHPED